MKTLLNILKSNGEEAVKLYKQTLVDNDRVATGDTKESIRYEAKEEGTKGKLTIYALDHIRTLETGQTAEDIKKKDNANFFDKIQEWVNSRDIGASKKYLVSARIYRSLLKNGWNTTRPNRTNQNGGTKGLITDVDKEVKLNVLDDIKKNIKKDILSELRLS